MSNLEKMVFGLLVVAIINTIIITTIGVIIMDNSKQYPQRFCTNCGYYIGSEISYGGDE